MTYTDLIINPAHYTAGRTHQPIKVIEDWGLCHHLGCAVKYLARAGRKGPPLYDLQKAAWYLEREAGLPSGCPVLPFSPHTYTTDDVIDDWQLSLYPGEVLYHIKASRSLAIRRESLDQAIRHLRTEVSFHSTPHPGV